MVYEVSCRPGRLASSQGAPISPARRFSRIASWQVSFCRQPTVPCVRRSFVRNKKINQNVVVAFFLAAQTAKRVFSVV